MIDGGRPAGIMFTVKNSKIFMRAAAMQVHKFSPLIGAEVTELIQGYVVAMNLETTEEELMHTVFPHPTLSEMMKEAVLDAYGRVLNA